MDSFSSIVVGRSVNKVPPPPKYGWQEKALAAISFFVDGQKNKGSIFKCFKQDERRAQLAFLDCKELNRPHAKYFFKVFSEINKRFVS